MLWCHLYLYLYYFSTLVGKSSLRLFSTFSLFLFRDINQHYVFIFYQTHVIHVFYCTCHLHQLYIRILWGFYSLIMKYFNSFCINRLILVLVFLINTKIDSQIETLEKALLWITCTKYEIVVVSVGVCFGKLFLCCLFVCFVCVGGWFLSIFATHLFLEIKLTYNWSNVKYLKLFLVCLLKTFLISFVCLFQEGLISFRRSTQSTARPTWTRRARAALLPSRFWVWAD